MADFDLTQTDQQVQNILNDAQGAMGASAQTTLTTEYVMLKDTSGIYHKILKSSFTEAIRDVLAGLLVNNDKGTTINQIAAIASGDFGSVTPANLASVLGEGYLPFCKVDTTTITVNTDWDDVTFGIYRTAATTGSAHTPPSTATRGYLLCFNRDIYGAQVYIENGNTAYWYFRSIWKTTDGWSAWQKIPSLAGLLASPTDLASLASALKPYLDAL